MQASSHLLRDPHTKPEGNTKVILRHHSTPVVIKEDKENKGCYYYYIEAPGPERDQILTILVYNYYYMQEGFLAHDRCFDEDMIRSALKALPMHSKEKPWKKEAKHIKYFNENPNGLQQRMLVALNHYLALDRRAAAALTTPRSYPQHLSPNLRVSALGDENFNNFIFSSNSHPPLVSLKMASTRRDFQQQIASAPATGFFSPAELYRHQNEPVNQRMPERRECRLALQPRDSLAPKKKRTVNTFAWVPFICAIFSAVIVIVLLKMGFLPLAVTVKLYKLSDALNDLLSFSAKMGIFTPFVLLGLGGLCIGAVFGRSMRLFFCWCTNKRDDRYQRALRKNGYDPRKGWLLLGILFGAVLSALSLCLVPSFVPLLSGISMIAPSRPLVGLILTGVVWTIVVAMLSSFISSFIYSFRGQYGQNSSYKPNIDSDAYKAGIESSNSYGSYLRSWLLFFKYIRKEHEADYQAGFQKGTLKAAKL
jgi:hypothetical protein